MVWPLIGSYKTQATHNPALTCNTGPGARRQRTRCQSNAGNAPGYLVVSRARTVSLIRAYATASFDLISLDYNIQGEQEGDAARKIAETPNRDARIIIHSMNPKGAALISSILPDAVAFPVNKTIASNARFKRLREGLARWSGL